MRRRLFHLTIKATGEHKYYGSLAAIFLDNKDLSVSKFTLDRYNFSEPFENEVCIIRKDFVLSTGDIRNAKALQPVNEQKAQSLPSASLEQNGLLGDVSSCKHLYNYYWKRGKCKGSKCILCGHLDRSLKPNVG